MRGSNALQLSVDAILAIKTIESLDARSLAKFVTTLIQHEVRPGGPYDFAPHPLSAVLNAHIIQLLAVPAKTPSIVESLRFSGLYGSIKERLSAALSQYDATLVKTTLQRVWRTDSHGEISKLSHLFYQSLSPKQQSKRTDIKASLEKLSHANIVTWTMYCLVDPLLDGTANPEQTLCATLQIHRSLIRLYDEAGVAQQTVDTLFSIVDIANRTELEMRSYISIHPATNTITLHKPPNHQTLKRLVTEKSIAHTIGILHISGSTLGSDDPIYRAMRYYCYARQLQDDIHDWQDDLRSGHVTYMVALLLKKANVQSGEYDIDMLLTRLKAVYWSSVLRDGCLDILHAINTSRHILETTALKPDSIFSTTILEPIQNAATTALLRHEFQKTFASEYAKITQ